MLCQFENLPLNPGQLDEKKFESANDCDAKYFYTVLKYKCLKILALYY
jgi:hypothetical protein